MKKDYNLFIIWHNALNYKDYIISDLQEHVSIVGIYEFNWSKNDFPIRLSKLYGKSLSGMVTKMQESGYSNFIVIVTCDDNPNYVNGVNSNILSLKAKYRKTVGGRFLVHASDNIEECNSNMLCLFGYGADEFENSVVTSGVEVSKYENNALVKFDELSFLMKMYIKLLLSAKNIK